MKTTSTLYIILILLLSISCQKEILDNHEDITTPVADETTLKSDFKIKRKTLTAYEWTKRASLDPRYAHTSLVFDDRMWIIAGKGDSEVPKNDVCYSFNGIDWQKASSKAAFPARFGHASTVFQGKMWVVGGKKYDPDDHDEQWDMEHDHEVQDDAYSELNDVWSSSDGVHWELVTSNADFEPRNDHTLTSFEGSLWLIGGTSNDQSGAICCGFTDVWKSDNGADWEKVYDFGLTSSRLQHTAITVGKNILTIGGENHSGNGAIRYSTNGNTWSTAVSEPVFGNRFGHSLAHDGQFLWLTEGNAGPEHHSTANDVWYSENGIEWLQSGVTKQFPTRADHTALFFKNRLWIINGKRIQKEDFEYSALSDIWSLEEPGCCDIDDVVFGMGNENP